MYLIIYLITKIKLEPAYIGIMLHLNILDLLKDLLKHSNNEIIYYTLCIITNMACGSPNDVNEIMQSDIVSNLMDLMESEEEEISSQAMWSLANLSCEGKKYVEIFVLYGIYKKINKVLKKIKKSKNEKLKKRLTHLLSCILIVEGPEKYLKKISNFLNDVLKCGEEETICDGCFALSFINEDPKNNKFIKSSEALTTVISILKYNLIINYHLLF